MLVLVVGPSGAGKDALLQGARRELADDARFRFVRRSITRPADMGDEGHEALEPDAFARRRDAGGFALHWQAHGLCYGIPADIAADLAASRTVIASVSRTVIAEAVARFPVCVLEVTAPVHLLAARLARRGRETEAAIAARLARRVALPDGVTTRVVMNDGTLAEGVARFLAAL